MQLLLYVNNLEGKGKMTFPSNNLILTMKKIKTHFCLLFIFLFYNGCNSGKIDITPHKVNPQADVFFQQAIPLLEYYDKDSTRKCIALIDNALAIDHLNPDYHGIKAKLYAELGLLDSALILQKQADQLGAINGEYLFQLGLFQAAKGFPDEAHISFGRSNDYLRAVLKQYPDSLGAFILQQAANALYVGVDSVFMNDVPAIRERFSDRLMEIEMTRRMKPSSLIKQIQQIEQNSFEDFASEIDKMLQEEENGKK